MYVLAESDKVGQFCALGEYDFSAHVKLRHSSAGRYLKISHHISHHKNIAILLNIIVFGLLFVSNNLQSIICADNHKKLISHKIIRGQYYSKKLCQSYILRKVTGWK